MKDIIKNVQDLNRFFDYYRVQLNNSRNPIIVPLNDVYQIQLLLEQLSKKVLALSPPMSAELVEIRKYNVSIEIESGRILAGNLPHSQQKIASAWVVSNKEKLLGKWNDISVSATSALTKSRL